MLDGMSDSIQRSRIENLHSREVDRQSPTGLIFSVAHSLYLVLVWQIYVRRLTRLEPNSISFILTGPAQIMPSCLCVCFMFLWALLPE